MQCRRPWLSSWVGKIHWRRDRLPTPLLLAFPCGSAGKESTWNAEDLVRVPELGPSVGKIPWRREWLPTPVFWPGEFHGLYSPWGCKEPHRTEWLSQWSQTFFHIYIGLSFSLCGICWFFFLPFAYNLLITFKLVLTLYFKDTFSFIHIFLFL